MLIALMVNFVAFTLLYVFLLGQRLRLANMEQRRDALVWEEARRV
jgi:hypothetical protein